MVLLASPLRLLLYTLVLCVFASFSFLSGSEPGDCRVTPFADNLMIGAEEWQAEEPFASQYDADCLALVNLPIADNCLISELVTSVQRDVCTPLHSGGDRSRAPPSRRI